MAGVASTGLAAQLQMMAWLRWKIFRNSLSKKGAALDLIALVLAGVFGAVFAVGAGIGLGIGAYFLTRAGKFPFFSLMLWGVFLVWQFMPLMVATTGSGFDFRNLLRFPLRFSTFYLLGLTFGLADPSVLAAMYWLLCITMGVTLANANLFFPCVLLFICFAAMNLLLNRMVFSWLERLLARRRSREALWAVLMLFFLLFQFSGMFMERWGRQLRPVVHKVPPLVSLLPPGLPGRGLQGLAQGEVSPLLVATALLLAYAAAFGLMLRFRLLAQYRGEDLGESPAIAAPRRSAAAMRARVAIPAAGAQPSFLTSLVGGPAIAVMQKEIRYLYRNSAMLLTLAIPLILILPIAFSFSSPRHAARNAVFTRVPDLAFPGAVAYMFLILGQFAHNSFAYDGRGVQLLYMAPVRFRDVLLGKNLALAILVAVETVLVGALIGVVIRPPSPLYVLATLAWLVFALLVHFIVGNWLSLEYPRRFDFGQYRRRASGMSVLVGMGLQIALLGLGVLVGMISLWMGRVWIFAGVFLVLSVVAFWLYNVTLEHYSNLAVSRREALTEQLVRSN